LVARKIASFRFWPGRRWRRAGRAGPG
jgi:hypothetical protein